MKSTLIFFIFILSFSLISATCTSGQININSASLSELDKLDGIGEVKAQAIIDSRPYSSLDDLLEVKGIGNITLAKIKAQKLACIDEIAEKSEDIQEDAAASVPIVEEKISSPDEGSASISADAVQSESIINLDQEVTIEQNKQTVYESKTEKIRKYSIYGFAFFLIFLIIVLLIKN